VNNTANAVVVLSALTVGCAAHAEGPYSVGAGISYNSDSNLFRAPRGEEVSDRFITASVFGGVDETISRQRLRANARLRHSWYRDRDDLDHNGYNVQLGWDGSTVGEISWSLAYVGNRSLASYSNLVAPALQEQNLETSHQASANLQLGLKAQWVANVALSHREIKYSADAFASERLKLDSVGVGVTWNPTGPLSVSVGPRYTRGRYPQGLALAGGGFGAETFDRRDLDLGVKWVASGASTLTGRLSVTKQEYDDDTARDFSGATGRVAWEWKPTGKTRLNTILSRDTGSESSFFNQSLVPGEVLDRSGDNSRVTNSLAMRLDYEVTAKTALYAGGAYSLRKLSSTTLVGGVPVLTNSGAERTGSINLGARYAPTRNSVIGCEVGHERRATSTTLSSPYRVNLVSCNAQLTLQPATE
jgi:hypothetical protein